MNEIQEILFSNQDLKYRDFHSGLVTNVGKEHFIGVRVPVLRKLAKDIVKNNKYKDFINDLPHYYLDENTLHACILSEIKDKDELIEEIDRFLPYVDNWAVCDSIKPKALKKYFSEYKKYVYKYLRSKNVYTIRFGVVMLLNYYLDDLFDKKDITEINKISNDDYYVKMAISWYYSFALIKQYDSCIDLFRNKGLDTWIHNKSIQKAVESYRVNDITKDYLRSLRVK